MKKGIIIAVGLVLLLGLVGGAYLLGVGQRNLPKELPEPITSPAASPQKIPSPIPLPQKGIIEGSMSFPGEGIPSYIQVCAENQTTKEILCTSKQIQDPQYTYGIGYQLEVPAGNYYVYSLDPNKNYKAYYTEFVTCGLSVDCPSHTLILVPVKAGETVTGIDPQDWYQ
jgi:hypothetical protein